MGVIQRSIVFFALTFSNAILFLFHSRVLLEIVSIANSFASGPGTSAINLLPVALQLAMGGIQLVAIVYLLGGLSEERAAQRRPMR